MLNIKNKYVDYGLMTDDWFLLQKPYSFEEIPIGLDKTPFLLY